MPQLQLPPIHKSIVHVRDFEGSPKNYITIKNSVAIILGNDFIFCFDLKSYYIDCQLIMEEDRDSFDTFLAWIEGKKFSFEFWEKLIGKGKNYYMVLNDECINVCNDKLSLDLNYEEPHEYNESDFITYIGVLKSHYKSPNQTGFNFSPKSEVLQVFMKGFGNMVKKVQMTFRFKSNPAYQIFTVDNMPFIFGLVTSDPAINDKAYNYENFSKFVNSF